MESTQQTQATLRYLDTELFDFDPENPRFGGTMIGKEQGAIQKALTEAPYFALELVDSLLKNGFIDYEPLVVKKRGNRYIMVEGNRRLAAIKEILSDPVKYVGKTEDLKNIPALVFPDRPDEAQESEMRVYLGVRHLIGFREWPPLSKAAFLDQLSHEPGGLEKILKELQIKKTNAQRFLLPFRVLKKAKIAIPKDEDFWTLGEALTRTGVKTFLELEYDSKTLEITGFSQKRLSRLLDFIYGRMSKGGKRDPKTRVLSETRELSRLAKVLGSAKASEVLLAGKSIAESEIYVDTPDESKERLSKVLRELRVLLKKVLAKNKTKEAGQVKSTHKAFDAAIKGLLKKGLT